MHNQPRLEDRTIRLPRSPLKRGVLRLLLRLPLRFRNRAPVRNWLAALLGECDNPALRRELVRMMRRDQRMRMRMLQQQPFDSAVDHAHTQRMKAIIAEHGYPGFRLVGLRGTQAAWLLIQHADHDLDFQKQCLELLRRAAESGDALPSNLAYLTDRVRVAEGLPQIYGTQFHGHDQPLPIEDERNVDARRAAMGLEPLADYMASMRRLKDGHGWPPAKS